MCVKFYKLCMNGDDSFFLEDTVASKNFTPELKNLNFNENFCICRVYCKPYIGIILKIGLFDCT